MKCSKNLVLLKIVEIAVKIQTVIAIERKILSIFYQTFLGINRNYQSRSTQKIVLSVE